MPVGGVFHAALLIGYTMSFFLFRPHPAIMESRIIPAQTPTIAVNTKVQFPVLVNTLPKMIACTAAPRYAKQSRIPAAVPANTLPPTSIAYAQTIPLIP